MNGIELLKKLKENNFYEIQHLSLFSSMVCHDSFLEKFKKELGPSSSNISLLKKLSDSGVKELNCFLSQVKNEIAQAMLLKE